MLVSLFVVAQAILVRFEWCDAGLHAMMALRAGARHVTAVDRWLYMALACKESLVRLSELPLPALTLHDISVSLTTYGCLPRVSGDGPDLAWQGTLMPGRYGDATCSADTGLAYMACWSYLYCRRTQIVACRLQTDAQRSSTKSSTSAPATCL